MYAPTTTPKPLLFLYLVSHFSSSAASFVSGIKGEQGIEMCRKKMVEKEQKDTSCTNQKNPSLSTK